MIESQAGVKKLSMRQVRALTGVVVAALIFSPAVVKLIVYPAYPGTDDAFIHIAIAEHILRGDGWGIASISRINPSSSPIFTALLLPVFAMGSIGLAQVASVLFACAALAITFILTRAVTNSAFCAVAALAVAAANVHLWRWSGTVLETSLGYLSVTAITTATLVLMGRPASGVRSLTLLGMLIGFGTLVRFEISLCLPLSTAALLFSWTTGRRRIAGVVVGFAATLAPWVVFATLYFGTPLPTTFSAKAGGFHLVNGSAGTTIGTVVASGSGISILIASVAVAMTLRSPTGRRKLREIAVPLLFLLAWPVALFGFYYLKMDAALISARYVLVGMATWPIAFGLIVSTLEAKRRYEAWLTVGLVGCMATAVSLNAIKITPVLTEFNGGYRSVMASSAQYLRNRCLPGETALIDFDIGIISRDGIGKCALADFGALASPELRGMTIEEALAYVAPTYVVETTATRRDDLAAILPQLDLQWSAGYSDLGVSNSGKKYLNLYRVNPIR